MLVSGPWSTTGHCLTNRVLALAMLKRELFPLRDAATQNCRCQSQSRWLQRRRRRHGNRSRCRRRRRHLPHSSLLVALHVHQTKVVHYEHSDQTTTVSISTKLKLYNTCIILLLISESTVVTKKDAHKTEALNQRCLQTNATTMCRMMR